MILDDSKTKGYNIIIIPFIVILAVKSQEFL